MKDSKYYIISCIVAILLGTLLHFTYDILNNNLFVGLFSPVNESVWEHLKLIAIPIILFSVITFIVKKEDVFLSSALAIIIGSFFILFIHYLFEGLDIKNMTVDILSYIVGMFIAFYYIYITNFKNTKCIGIILIILILATFPLFTLKPPKLQLFLDETTNTYGIL